MPNFIVETTVIDFDKAVSLIVDNELPCEAVLNRLGLWLIEVHNGNHTYGATLKGKPNKRDIRRAVKLAKRGIHE